MAYEVHVAAGARPDGDGSRSDPVPSLDKAIGLAADRGAAGATRILVHPGDYFDTSVTVGPALGDLTIEAAGDLRPRLLGGRRITGWQAEGERFVAAPLPGVAEGAWDFRLLIVNGSLRPRARFPERGALRHDSFFDVEWMSSTGGGWQRKPTDRELREMRFPPGQLPRSLVPENAELTIYHAWDESLVGVKTIDHEAGWIEFRHPAGHPPGAFGMWKEQSRTYVVWNTREGMFEPGRWYLDRAAGRVVYWPCPGERVDELEVLAPAAERVVTLAGEAQRPVDGVTLRGLEIGLTTTPPIAGGFGAGRFAGAVEGEHVRALLMEDVRLRHAGGQGVRISRGEDVSIRRCEAHETGAGGLHLNGRGFTVEDNHIHHVGRTYPAALALRCGGSDHLVRHNELHHTPYTAVNSGGTNIRIESNRFHHVMEELVDGAAIYMFAANDCAIRGNHTFDVRDEQVHAYYLDERSEGSVVEDNLAEGVAWPLHMHMATGCAIRRNLCLHDGDMRISLMSCDRFTVEQNIFSAGGKLTLAPSYTALGAFRRNLLFSGAGEVAMEMHDRLPSRTPNPGPVSALPEWESNLLGDPRLERDGTGRYAFAADSAAPTLGLGPIDVSVAGRRPGVDGPGAG